MWFIYYKGGTFAGGEHIFVDPARISFKITNLAPVVEFLNDFYWKALTVINPAYGIALPRANADIDLIRAQRSESGQGRAVLGICCCAA